MIADERVDRRLADQAERLGTSERAVTWPATELRLDLGPASEAYPAGSGGVDAAERGDDLADRNGERRRGDGALSAFNSDVIREPLAGRDYDCPVGADATIWVTSRRAAVANLLRLAACDGAAIGAQRAVTAPALAISVGEVVAALGRVDAAAPARVSYRPQAAIEAQFGRWPRDCAFARAQSLGLVGEASIDTLIRDHLESTA